MTTRKICSGWIHPFQCHIYSKPEISACWKNKKKLEIPVAVNSQVLGRSKTLNSKMMRSMWLGIDTSHWACDKHTANHCSYSMNYSHYQSFALMCPFTVLPRSLATLVPILCYLLSLSSHQYFLLFNPTVSPAFCLPGCTQKVLPWQTRHPGMSHHVPQDASNCCKTSWILHPPLGQAVDSF